MAFRIKDMPSLHNSVVPRSLPEPATALVIAAAHPNTDVAISAWKSWRASHAGADRAMELATDRDCGNELLPTVAYRLSGRLPADELEPATAARRQSARANLKLLAGLTRALAALNDVGITPIVLKGGAMLTSAVFGDLSARWLSDIDILIEPEEAAAAFQVFAGLGFTRWPEEVPEHVIRSVMHAASFADSSDFNLDVHWTLLHNTRCTNEDRNLRSRAGVAEFGPVAVRVPDRTDMLLHTLAHGKLPEHRWIVDAAYLLDPNLNGHGPLVDGQVASAPAEIDAHRLAAVASNRRYLARVTENAAILANVLPGPRVDTLRAALAAESRHFGDSTNVEYGNGRMSNRVKAAMLITFNQIRDRTPAEALGFVARYPMYLSHVGSYSEVIRKLHPKNRHVEQSS